MSTDRIDMADLRRAAAGARLAGFSGVDGPKRAGPKISKRGGRHQLSTPKISKKPNP